MKAEDAELWREIQVFIRGDTGASEFEAWSYATSSLEALLGPELYLNLVSTDFRHAGAVYELRQTLASSMPVIESQCACSKLPDLADIGMFETAKYYEIQDRRTRYGEQRWWLGLNTCRVCGQNWLFAQESRINDVVFFNRVDEARASLITETHSWPEIFSSYSRLLRLGRDRGHRVQYWDPVNSNELKFTIIDLALEKPGISISELVELLPVTSDIARLIAAKAIEAEGVDIDMTEA
jgi:hypothetical protein